MTEGCPPNYDIPTLRAMRLIANPKIPPPTFAKKDKYSEEIIQFVANCLQKDPSSRPTPLRLLKEPFVLNVPVENFQKIREGLEKALREMEEKRKRTTNGDTSSNKEDQDSVKAPKKEKTLTKKKINKSKTETKSSISTDGSESPVDSDTGTRKIKDEEVISPLKERKKGKNKKQNKDNDDNGSGTMKVKNIDENNTGTMRVKGTDEDTGTMRVKDIEDDNDTGTMRVKDIDENDTGTMRVKGIDEDTGTMRVKDIDENNDTGTMRVKDIDEGTGTMRVKDIDENNDTGTMRVKDIEGDTGTMKIKNIDDNGDDGDTGTMRVKDIEDDIDTGTMKIKNVEVEGGTLNEKDNDSGTFKVKGDPEKKGNENNEVIKEEIDKKDDIKKNEEKRGEKSPKIELVVSRKGVDQKRNEGDNIYNSKIIRSSSAGKLESSLFVLDKEIKVSRDKIKNNGLKKTGNLRRKARSRSREKQNQLNPQKISKVQFSPGNKRKVVDLESEKKRRKRT